MRKHYFFVSLLALALSVPGSSFASVNGAIAGDGIVVTLGAPQMRMMAANAPAQQAKMVINGTGESGTFTVNAQNLAEDIKLTATSGFEVYPETLPAGSTGQKVIVTFNSYKSKTGQVILRSGDYRAFVDIEGVATPLAVKDLSQNPVYTGSDDEVFEHDKAGGFTAGENGYTIEFRVKTDNLNKSFDVYGITEQGLGFKAYVNSKGLGFYNGTTMKNIFNPFSYTMSGGGTIYNDDAKYHTYRFAVTPDKRIFVYRDAILIDEARVADFGMQPEWLSENGELEQNLLKNPDFEGEWEQRLSDNLIYRVEGWDIGVLDQYNSYQQIENREIDNEQDYTNHALCLYRYRWEPGWGANEISQIVNVSPNEVYSLKALAKGGYDAADNRRGSIRITEVQNADNTLEIPVTSSEKFETYSADFETSADCNQLRVTLYLERLDDKRECDPLVVDNMSLTGVSRTLNQRVGFENSFSDLEYFNYDATGAYAPAVGKLEASSDSIVIDGTNKTVTVKLHMENLRADEPIQIITPKGFDIYPTELPSNIADQEFMVTNISTIDMKSEIVLRSGETRRIIKVTGLATPLEHKDIMGNLDKGLGIRGTGEPGDADDGFVVTKEDGFVPSEDGYTVEFRVNTDNLNKTFFPYAVTDDANGFYGYIGANKVGLYDAIYERNIVNPATKVDGGTGLFYNDDNRFHTYRYAVTQDRRAFVYRDGLVIDTLQLRDFSLDASAFVEAGDIQENLLKNGDFESTEYDQSGQDNSLVKLDAWNIEPMDRWNAYARLTNYEIDNDLDYATNHALSVYREAWGGNYGAIEISQVVNVVPGETYEFSALGKGGYGTNGATSQKEWLGSFRIREVQNPDLGETVSVVSDNWETYTMSYTTSSECTQLRVYLYMERTPYTQGASMVVDQMKLVGRDRVPEQKVGFNSEFAGLDYFTYDLTGAYAPLEPGFGDDVTGIEDTNSDATGIKAQVTDSWLYLRNVPESAKVEVYNSAGVLVATEGNYTSGQAIPLREKGVYVCVVDDGAKKQTVKVVY
ncbi:carbohydrate binding domain-containing protein [Bacteroides sp.]